MRVTETTVRAVNELTSRWARDVRGSTVFSAAGVWPLLAFLADGAGGPARAELGEAIGLPPERAAQAARELLAALDAVPGVGAAIGLWTKRTVTLRERWAEGLPPGAHGVLTGDVSHDQAALDAWTAKHTDGQIERMPAVVGEDSELALAGALALCTTWLRPFSKSGMTPESGPWRDLDLIALRRTSSLPDRVGVAATPAGAITELRVLGDTGVDVHLLLGEEGMTPGQVLAGGVGVLGRAWPRVPGTHLPYGEPGPGLTVGRERHERPLPPQLHVTTVPFTVTAEHDLNARSDLFGLTTAMDDGFGHFPGVAVEPLAVGRAAQAATATFGELGFRAAAATAIEGLAGSVPRLRYSVTEIDATFDRPFGFLAVHRRTRLVLAAGWVGDPEPFREDEDEEV
ncbi:serpin family protein [Streptomyces sp. NPDC127108]|uniref:serpin family protein n=1 Tax=Streptomyces sp. NPDC127108 TaxID=3345361 RepID=UPI00363350A2